MKLPILVALLFTLSLCSCDKEDYCRYNGDSYSEREFHPDDPCIWCYNGEWRDTPGCCIDGVLYSWADRNPDNECEGCSVINNLLEQVDHWTLRPQGARCGDGGACDGEGNCIE